MLVKKGDRGRIVKEIQTLLNEHGFWTYGKFTDYFGDVTEGAVKNFQIDNDLEVDGKVGNTTYNYLLRGVDTDRLGIDDNVSDTDNKLDYKGEYTASNGLIIDRVYLDTDEYVKQYGKIEPYNLFIHHTAGWDNPYNTVNSWNIDTRGRIATQYVIGGPSIKGTDKYDGTVVECFPDGYIGWHLGKVGNFNLVSKPSVGIELNNFGYVIKKGDKYYNYVNREVPADQVVDLGYEFRGHRYWHKYSDKQLENLKLLIQHIKEVYPTINISNGLPDLLKRGVSPKDAFEFNNDAYYGKVRGTWTHTSVRKDKFDCYPDERLVELLKSL